MINTATKKFTGLALASLGLTSLVCASENTLNKSAIDIKEQEIAKDTVKTKLPFGGTSTASEEKIASEEIEISSSSAIFGSRSRTPIDLYGGFGLSLAGWIKATQLEVTKVEKTGFLIFTKEELIESKEIVPGLDALVELAIYGGGDKNYNLSFHGGVDVNFLNGTETSMGYFLFGASGQTNAGVATLAIGGGLNDQRELNAFVGKLGVRTQLNEFNIEGGIFGAKSLTEAEDQQPLVAAKISNRDKEQNIIRQSNTYVGSLGFYAKGTWLF